MKVGLVGFYALAIFLFVGVASAVAQQPKPPGSYLQTCNAIIVNGGTLTATCAPKEGSSILGGQPFVGKSTIENFFECHGDISNNNGTLTCSRNAGSMTMKKTSAAVRDGMTMVLGVPPSGSTDINMWIARMFASGMQADFYKNHGFTKNDTIVYFRNYLAADAAARSGVIRRAFLDVYNLTPSSADAARWDAEVRNRTTGYSQIVSSEQQKMNSAKPVRRLMIIAAYQRSMGRPASPGDLSYWEGRHEIFKEIVDAARGFLYSPNGTKDLDETVRRAWQARTGNTASISEFESAKKKAVSGKLIYVEML